MGNPFSQTRWFTPALSTVPNSDMPSPRMHPSPDGSNSERPPQSPPLNAGVRRLFQTPDYRFQFGMRRSSQDWFDLKTSAPDALAERRRWIAETREKCVVWTPEAEPALAATRTLFPALPPEVAALPPNGHACAAFSACWEPDFLLLRSGPDGEQRLVGGCVCFPSAWCVTEKLGLNVTAIHDPVPTLNAELGERIRRFLNQLKPGTSFERENWGLAAHGERNAHPDRGMPRLQADTPLDRVWLRVEYQAFVALPGDAGLLFVIHLVVYPVTSLLHERETVLDFRRMLESMPESIAVYKGIAHARESLVRQLAAY